MQLLEDRRVLSVTPPVLYQEDSTLVIQGGDVKDTVVVSESAEGMISVRHTVGGEVLVSNFAEGSVALIEFYGGAGDDSFSNLTAIDSYAEGGAGVDLLIGGSGDDELHGGDGTDYLEGGAGNDSLYGQQGRDRLIGQDGDDLLQGHEGEDVLVGGQGGDILLGDGGADQLHGGDGNDLLFGGADDDLVYGKEGNDRLDGGDGDDYLDGGNGNDSLYGQEGRDQLIGNAGNDWLQGHQGDDVLKGGSGRDVLLGDAGADQLRGGAADDLIDGGSENDLIYGEDGNDRLDGGAGDDYIEGGAGDDFLFGSQGRDRLLGHDGNDRLEGGDGDDTLYGHNGYDLLFGDAGADQLRGGAADDIIDGGSENDLIYGEDGNDRLDGGAGDDYLEGGTGEDSLYGKQGRDRLLGQDGNDRLQGGDGNDTLFGHNGYDVLFGGDGVDQLHGGADDDSLYGGEDNDLLYGEAGGDRLEGGAGDDYLEGGDGDDSLYGHQGRDRLLGHEGDDRLEGGDGDDSLYGGDDADVLLGGSGADQLYGEAGADHLFAGGGDDILQGAAGDDVLYGDAGADYLQGDDGDDTLFGGDGDDTIIGGADNDTLAGGADQDSLFGGDGRDILRGGDGRDQLHGEADADALVGGGGDDSLFGDVGNDLLFGGGDTDALFGGDGDDILIGASTVYDADNEVIREALATWDSGLSYNARVGLLSDPDASIALAPSRTLLADNVADELYGSAGQDWFLLSAANATYSRLGAQSGLSGSVLLTDELPAVEGFALIDSIDQTRDVASSEAIHSLLPHADDPSKRSEHLRLFQLVRYADVTHTALSSGGWSDPANWEGGQVPSAGARVLVPYGVHLTVDRELAVEIDTLRVDGTLSFATGVDTELRVDTVVVTDSGSFEMGTDSSPVQAGVTARLTITNNGPIDRVADPYALGRGLITHGSVEMYGAEVTSHGVLSGPLNAGATSFTLAAAPTNWNVGDEVVIAGTAVDSGQDEVRRILAINGARVWVDPLDYDHAPVESGLEVHVANLTRNVVIESESTQGNQGGHVMFMHNRDVHISYAAFNDLGRTDKSVVVDDPAVDDQWNLVAGTGTNPRARYAVHFHRNGVRANSAPATVHGSVVNGSPGWGYVNHSSYVDITDSVAYGVNGSAFVTEAGDEIGSFDGNIALHTTGVPGKADSRDAQQDFGFNGDAFWLQGPGVSVTNNVAAGSQGSAFFYYTRGLRIGGHVVPFLAENLDDPSLAGGNDTLAVDHAVVKQFSGNTGYASGVGLTIRYHLRNAQHDGQSVLSDSTFWNNQTGVHVPYTHNTVLRGLEVVVDPEADAPIGVNNNAETRDITYQDLRVEGYVWALLTPTKGTNSVVGGRYVSKHWNVVVRPADSAELQVRVTGDIEFGGVGGVAVQDVAMHFLTANAAENPTHVFNEIEVLLSYGHYSNHQLFFREQSANAVPFDEPEVRLPAEYVGLTSAELASQYGVAIGGEVAPEGAYTASDVQGLLFPKAESGRIRSPLRSLSFSI